MSRGRLLNATIGEYRVIGFLGAGGMGEVYRAVHTKIGRVVAIKVLTEHGQGPEAIERSRAEARIQASLHHPHIATLYDFHEHDGRPCLIMEYVDGETLADRLRTAGPLPLAEALRISAALAEAIDHIHSHGIIHRDIKSQNVKLTVAGEVKLLDFGIARAAADPRLTVTGCVVGTLACLAPEQLRGGTADERSEIWALGILLYEMLTGRVPFTASTFGELYEQITRKAYAPPSVANAEVPAEVAALVARCLKKRPADRYQSARELRDDLRRVAGRPSAGRRAVPFDRRWMMAAGAALLALILVLTLPRLAQHWPRSPMTETAAPGATPGWRSIQIDAAGGHADVYRGEERLGTTPYLLEARVGDKVALELRRKNLRRVVDFSVTANRKVYTFSLE